MLRPTLSVVMPTRNHAHLVGRAIDAIATQSAPPLELIVVDDASTDDTPAVLASLAARHPFVRLVRNARNLGVAGAANLGFGLARGDFVYGAASDDWVLPGAFERALSLAAEFPACGVVFGPMFVLARPPCVLRAASWTRPLFAPPDVFVREYLEVEAPAFALGGAAYYRREPFLALGGLRAELGSYCDTFAFRALGARHGACYVPEPLMAWNVVPDSYSQTTRRDPRRQLEIVARAARLMRSPAFRDVFPERHVARWERAFRAEIVEAACRDLEAALAAVTGACALGGASLEARALGRLAGALDLSPRLVARLRARLLAHGDGDPASEGGATRSHADG